MKHLKPHRKDAFALVIALSLMAFILLLLLSITTLLQVESGTSAISKKRAEARLNAMLGLQIAVGNLQKLAGADTRATATADILPDGYAAVAVPAGAEHWTGVWDSTEPDRDAGFLGWLVSASNPNRLYGEEADAVALPADTRTLVGEGSSEASRFVEAPTVEVNGSGNQVTGRYAYWVGDEGVKAKFQGVLPSRDDSRDERAQFDFRLNQRNALETFGDLNNDALGDTFDPAASLQLRSVSWSDLFLADTSDTVVPEVSALKEAYFDYTPYSYGLLTDSKSGGWKKDLTWLFEESEATVRPFLQAIDARNNAATTSEISADWPLDGRRKHWSPSPTWELLRSYYRLASEAEPLPMRRQTAIEHGVSPVVTHLIVNLLPGLNGTYLDNGTPVKTDDYFEGNLRVYIDVQVVVWNPYDVAIDMPEMDLEILWPDDSGDTGTVNRADARMRFGDYSGGSTTTHAGTLVDTFVGPGGEGFFSYRDTFTTPAVNARGLTFQIPATVIGAGEMLLFGISDSEDGQGYTGQNKLVNASNLGFPNTVWLESPDTIGLASAPLDGSELDEPFTFEKLFPMDRSNVVGGPIIQHVALREAGTGGDDSVGGHNDFYGRYARRKSMGSSFDQVGDLDAPNLLVAIFDFNGDGTVAGGEYGLPQAAPSYVVDHALHFNAHMHSSQVNFRNSRWAMNYNPRAHFMDRTEVDRTNNPNHGGEWRSKVSNRHSFDNTDISGGRTLVANRPHFAAPFWQYRTSLFSLPRRGYKPLNLGDLQHVNVHPEGPTNAYIISNSLVDQRLTNTSELVRYPANSRRPNYAPNVDGSYLLNDVLWDGYFFSTVDGSLDQADVDAGKRFPNARIRLADESDLDTFESDPLRFDEGAAQLRVDGMFNINSTSVEAWKAVLGAANGVPYDPAAGTLDSDETGLVFSRLLRPQGNTAAGWLGYRELEKEELQLLATEIVAAIRRRGPFLTLADFVNRELGGDAADPEARFVKGVLAEAVDAAAVNTNTGLSLPNVVNSLGSLKPNTEAWYIEEALEGSTSAGATRWLTQGDLLQKIGGMVAARSDTFVVRSYGSSLQSVSGQQVEAYLEAVVRRVPEPVAPLAGDPINPDTMRTPDFGRRFTIVSMRWLQEEEI